MTIRRLLRERTWPYTLSEADQTYEEIAETYQTTYEALVELNPETLRLDGARSHPVVRFRDVIQVPIPEWLLGYEWEDYRVEPRTNLRIVCETRNRTPGRISGDAAAPNSSAPELTPRFLWNLVMNCDFRRQCIAEQPSMRGATDERILRLAAVSTRSVLRIPWPRRLVGRSIHVAPNSAGAPGDRPTWSPSTCTSCGSAPDWVDVLYVRFIVPMGQWVERLRAVNQQCKQRLEEYLRELGHLHVIELLIRAMGREGNAPPVDELLERGQRLSDRFTSAAHGAHQRDFERGLYGPLAAERESLGTRLREKLMHQDFNRLVKRAFDEDDYVVGERETVRSRVCGLMADVCAQILLVPSLCEEMASTIDQALEAWCRPGAATPTRAAEGANAIGTVLSLGTSNIGLPPPGPAAALATTASIGAVFTTLVGNLPGPPSLAVALFELKLQHDLPRVAPLLRSGVPRGPDRTLAGRRVAQLAAVSQMDEQALLTSLRAARSEQEVQAIANRLSGRFQSGRGWCSVLAAISLLGLIVTAEDRPEGAFASLSGPNPEGYAQWLLWAGQLAAGGANTVSAFLGMIERFGEGGRFETFATGLGRFATVVTVIVSGGQAFLHFYRAAGTNDPRARSAAIRDGVVCGIQAGGGVLLLLPGPWAVVGIVIVTGTTILQVIFDAENAPPGPNTRKTVLQLIEQLKRQTRVASVLRTVTTLRLQLDDYAGYVRGSQAFIHIHEASGFDIIHVTSPARRILRDARVDESVINAFIHGGSDNRIFPADI